MASKQRSFFDQNHSNKTKWYNNKRQFRPDFAPPPPPKPPVVQPPIVPSTQSRSKLNAFRYESAVPKAKNTMPRNHVAFAEKENLRPSQQQGKAKELVKGGTSPNGERGETVRDFPSTPAGRVPLADLIGNNEEVLDNSPRKSPLDAVSWDQLPIGSNDSLACMTPIMRRGKKRVRSVSPTLSQKARAAKSLFDLNAVFKTPQNDPALDLENRYFARSKHQTPSKPSSSAAPDFMHSSSPVTPVLASGESAKLRRTVSCGVAWPSGNKRRKITDGGLAEPRRSPTTDFATIDRQGELQKINLLLDSIHDNLPDSTKSSQPGNPPSSCPLPAEETVETEAVTLSKILSSHNVQSRQAPVPTIQDHAPALSQHREPPEDRESSDFGDTDVDPAIAGTGNSIPSSPAQRPNDEAILNAREPHVKLLEQQIGIGGKLPANKIESDDPSISLHLSQSAEQKLCLIRDFNDNGDDESDDFAADMELVASLYDEQPSATDTKIDEPQHKVNVTDVVQNLPIQPELDNIPDTSKAARAVLDISSDEEFGDDDFEEIANEIERATQAGEDLSSKKSNETTILRYVIVSVTESMYEKNGRSACPEKVVHIQEDKKKQHKVVLLRDSWFDSPCNEGSFVHVLGSFDKLGQCVVDDAENFLILHPDHLISATVVADSFSCTRRAVLQDRVKATSAANAPQVYGHILHEVFQEALKANRWDTEWLTELIGSICTRYLETLYEIQVEVRLAVDHLMSKVPELQAWARLFVSARLRSEAVVQDRNGGTALMSINKLLDVEEHVWSPRYGLKGNIDATVQVLMKDTGDERTLTVPLEVKTGKNNSSVSHKAQTALYTLLLSDRYDVQIAYGILYYLETSETSRIAGVRRELVGMIKQRNLLACYVRDRVELPPMLKDTRMCGKCYAQKACFAYHRLTEDGDGRTSGLKATFMDAVKHLQPAHREFFKKWDDLLTKEEADVLKFRRELWTMLSSERERVGRCFGSLVIEPGSAEELTDAPKINRFQYAFVKHKDAPNFSFTDSQITIGEPIVVSDEAGHYALANGYVTHVRKNRITVAVDRRLHNARIKSQNFNAETNQNFAGIMQVVEHGETQQTLTPQEPASPVLYRLDKDEFSNGMATVRNNLIRLMDGDLFGSSNLRKLIVEGSPPSFSPSTSQNNRNWTSSSQDTLNVDQKAAIGKVMSANHYALVLGMPGTGKTTTIAHIIRALTAMGKSVLLTSYTHTAVDNILLKLRPPLSPSGTQNRPISILRLGALAKIHPDISTFADLACTPKSSFQELESSYSAQVVATTCLGINHPIFHSRIFDYCIVDEASQITLPVCLGPIGMAKKFVLVGDHFQLPPLVQNKAAAEGGLDVSLFKALSDRHPASVVSLEHQYRMCEDIMALSNSLIYDGRLKCGTEAVGSRRIKMLGWPAGLKGFHHTSPETLASDQKSFCVGPTPGGGCWLYDALDGERRVVFLDTDALGPSAREIAKGNRITNSLEVTLTTHLVESILSSGVSASDVGVITLYRSQLALLKHSLRRHQGAVEMHTADRFQGRDKEAVILSLVRSNEVGNVGELLLDWRRVNVALTRARTKLVIIGSLATVKRGSELLRKFAEMCQARGWVRSLREGEVEGHSFEEWRTQTQGVSGVLEASREEGETKEEKGDGKKVRFDLEDEKMESDMEVGRRGQSPKKSPKKNVVGDNRGRLKMRRPEKVKRWHIDDVFKRRPVMRDVRNQALG